MESHTEAGAGTTGDPLRVLLGVTGGIAAYKAAELVRLLQKAGHDVTVMQTRASTRFVGPTTFAALTGRAVLIDHDDVPTDADGTELGQPAFPHIDAGRTADVLIVAPATANTIARFAGGIAEDVLSNAYLAFTGPVIVAPAMNTNMWNHPATRRNLERLRADGVIIVEPEAGLLACGDVGAGRLAPVEQISATIEQVAAAIPSNRIELAAPDLAGLTVLVTAGGTSEPIDSVRSISNRSSGRMGVAIAEAAVERGAQVRLIVTSSVADQLLTIDPVARVGTTAELAAALEQQLPGCDVVVMAAAVSDFTVDATPGKLGRSEEQVLRLLPTPDLLGAMAQRRSASPTPERPVLIGFAAEAGDGGLDRARGKLQRKQVDAIVYNDISRTDIGFASPDNEVIIILAEREQHVERSSKATVAHRVLDAAITLLARTTSATPSE